MKKLIYSIFAIAVVAMTCCGRKSVQPLIAGGLQAF